MSAESFPQATAEAQRIHDQELAHLGALLVEASLRDDLRVAVEQHIGTTGEQNPNSVPPEGSVGLHIGSAEVPMSSENVYRQVHGSAVEDLAKSGVVRNPVTAGVKEQTRWGHRVFWNSGEDGRNTSLGGRMVIEADKQAARSGWVAADQVKAVYARDSDGVVKNIMS